MPIKYVNFSHLPLGHRLGAAVSPNSKGLAGEYGSRFNVG